MGRETIAVDVDEVLADQAGAFVAWSNQRWGTHLKVEDYSEHWAEIWGVDNHEVERRTKAMQSEGVVAGLEHSKEARDVLAGLALRYKLVVATSRPKIYLKDTSKWLDLYYKGIFDDIHYSGIWDKIDKNGDEVNATKAELVSEIGADYLIDDQLKHCAAVAGLGKTALLFGSYPWNQAPSLPEKVTRVENWTKVGQFFDEKAR